MNEEDWESADESDESIGDNVIHANRLTDPLTLAESCRQYSCKDGSTATVKHFTANSLSSKLLKWTLDLLTRNMRSMYKKSSWGWKPKEKKAEMTEDAARFLIAFLDDTPVAFSHFRFDMDYSHEVVYCYEIQLEEHVRTLGLGRHLMTTLEVFAAALNLDKIVLTVFKHNPEGIGFFRKIGYNVDESSPEENEGKSYFILSKPSSDMKTQLLK